MSIIIKLIFTNEISVPELKRFNDASDWCRLFRVAERQRVLYPLIIKLESILNEKGEEKILQIIENEKERYFFKTKRALMLLENIALILNNSIEYLVIKTLDDYPNIPSDDMDILVRKKDIEKIQHLFKYVKYEPLKIEIGTQASFGEMTEKRHFLYEIDDVNLEVEIYPDFSTYGETLLNIENMFTNSQSININNNNVFIPSPEDSLYLICLHSVFKHSGVVRLSDLYHAIRIIKNNILNWNYILRESYDNGTLIAILHFLFLVDEFYRENTGTNLLPPSFYSSDFYHYSEKRKHISEIPYLISFTKYLQINLYKIIFDLNAGRIQSAIFSAQTTLIRCSGRLLRFVLTYTYRKGLKHWGWYDSTKIEYS